MKLKSNWLSKIQSELRLPIATNEQQKLKPILDPFELIVISRPSIVLGCCRVAKREPGGDRLAGSCSRGRFGKLAEVVMTVMVQLEMLAKNFGPLRAVDAVSFSVSRGEVVGFLGPNGAGKSTTMRMLTGFVTPSSGTAKVMDFDVVRQPIEVKKRIGYLPEGAPGYADMSVENFLAFVGRVRGFKRKELRERVVAAAEKTSLMDVMYRPIETLSKGYRRRVGLAQAILHDPPVLVMDEPTDGLDPNQKFEVRRLIEEMAGDKAIIISTHILEEVDAVCTRAVVIAGGKIVADAEPEMLKRNSPLHNAVRINLNAEDEQRLRGLVSGVAGMGEVRTTGRGHGMVQLLAVPRESKDLLGPINALIRKHEIAVNEVALQHGSLDDTFRQLTGYAPQNQAMEQAA